MEYLLHHHFGKPKLSFCGAANRNIIDKYGKSFEGISIQNTKNRIFKPYQNLDVPLSGMSLRGRILESVKKI